MGTNPGVNITGGENTVIHSILGKSACWEASREETLNWRLTVVGGKMQLRETLLTGELQQ